MTTKAPTLSEMELRGTAFMAVDSSKNYFKLSDKGIAQIAAAIASILDEQHAGFMAANNLDGAAAVIQCKEALKAWIGGSNG